MERTPYPRPIKGFMAPAAILAAALAQAPTASAAVETPDLDHLQRVQPGWTIVVSEGTPESGNIQYERKVWPQFYLHWWPWDESMGRTITEEAAAKLVAGIWDGLTIDEPLEGREIALTQHPAVLFETTTSGGAWATRYVVWYCPESFRIFVADANLNLGIAAPEELLDWQIDIVRSVRCHTTAHVERQERLTSHQNIRGAELALDLPGDWAPVKGYRVQSVFAGKNFKSEMPGNTALRGQALFLANDAVRQFHFFWSAEEDFPMSYDVLQKKLEDYWMSRASDMMILASAVHGEYWLMDGIMMYTPEGLPFFVPAGRFRCWMWREGGVTYFAVGSITPSRFGRRDPDYDWADSFQRMFESFGL